MTDSFRKIDYRLRPAKQAERSMIVDLIRRLRFQDIESYSYIGMGSVAFIDHKMMHRHAGISSMISFEGTEDEVVKERFRRNVPLGCIDMRFGMSNEVLPDIAQAEPTIVWLDYDDQISRSMAEDLRTLANSIAAGSFVAITFATSFPREGAEKRQTETERLVNDFPEFIDERSKPNELENSLSELGRSAFGALFEKAMNEVDAAKEEPEKRKLQQVCYFRYRDGAPMCTVSWIVYSDRTQDKFMDSALERLPFYRTSNDAFVIRIPKVTPFEVREMERRLPDLQNAAEVAWIPPSDRRDFESLYRYLPSFGIFEPI